MTIQTQGLDSDNDKDEASQLFIGIDAGATKTTFILGDAHRELARSTAGTMKLIRTNLEQADLHVSAGLRELSATSGIPLTRVLSTCVGIAGVSIPAVRDGAENILRKYLNGKLVLCGDVEIALDAAFAGGRGIVVIAGTGSNVAGRTAAGSLVHAGGWGPALGDQGSGYWFGHHALRRLMHALDARESTMLLDAVLKTWNLKTVRELVAVANQTPPPDFSTLMPAIADCATNGDPLCSDLMREGGELLADQVAIVAEKIYVEESDRTPVKVAFTGSVLSQVVPVRQAMISALAQRFPEMSVLPEPIDPPQGALWRAQRAYFSEKTSATS
jgi:glucosamine kinase